MRDQSNKNKYFFAMSPFKVVYLCTFISISVFPSLLWMVERVFDKQAFAHSEETLIFFRFLLKVNSDDGVARETKSGPSIRTVKGNLGWNGGEGKERKGGEKASGASSRHRVAASTSFQESEISKKMFISCRQVSLSVLV